MWGSVRVSWTGAASPCERLNVIRVRNPDAIDASPIAEQFNGLTLKHHFLPAHVRTRTRWTFSWPVLDLGVSVQDTVGRSSRAASSRRCQTPRPRLIAAPVHIAGTEAVAASLAVARAAAAGTASGTPSSRHGRRRTGTVLGHVAALRRVPSLD